MKDLKQITVIGLGLLGGSITLRVLLSLPGVKTIGYTHRPSTRTKARKLAVAAEIVDNLRESVFGADLVILATPVYTFEKTFIKIRDALSGGCVVTDVGSTKVLPHRRAAKISHLPHIAAAALINCNSSEDLKFAGKGFIDTSRTASGPANIWADVLLTNVNNTIKGIDRIIAELLKIKKAIKNQNKQQIENLLEAARKKRGTMINYKINNKELIS